MFNEKHLNVYKTHVDSYLIYTLHVSNKKVCCLLCVAFDLWEIVWWHVNELDDENWICEIVFEFECVYQVVVNKRMRDAIEFEVSMTMCACNNNCVLLKTYDRCVIGIEKIDRYQIRIKLIFVRMDWGFCVFAIRGVVSCGGTVSVCVLIVTTWNTIYSIL